MAFQVQDNVAHKSTDQKMVVRGIGDFNGRELVWCEWTFPADELRVDAVANSR